jgi:gluconolactonase
LLAELGCDGMTVDEKGNVYLTNLENSSIDIYSPEGKRLESIQVPERPANVCFGGPERRTLFITARTSLYALDMLVRGHRK